MNKKVSIIFATALFALVANVICAQQVSTTPAVRILKDGSQNKNWLKLVEKDAEKAKKGGWDLVLVGDSITAAWRSGVPASVWAKHFPAYKTLNLAIAADATEHVLWRLNYEGMLGGYQPKLFIVMIGTNNTGFRIKTESPQDTADGIKAILDTIREKAPEAKILLLAIFPRGEKIKDDRNMEINALIEKYADNKHIFWLNINAGFLRGDGTLNVDLYGDKQLPYPIHINDRGYEIWAEAMRDKVDDLMKVN